MFHNINTTLKSSIEALLQMNINFTTAKFPSTLFFYPFEYEADNVNAAWKKERKFINPLKNGKNSLLKFWITKPTWNTVVYCVKSFLQPLLYSWVC